VNRYLFDLSRDVAYALRVLAQAPGFTAVGILSLTLGIGHCSVFYSEINSLVLRPLPVVRHPEALVALETLSLLSVFRTVPGPERSGRLSNGICRPRSVQFGSGGTGHVHLDLAMQ
jgi:hypothetical protein